MKKAVNTIELSGQSTYIPRKSKKNKYKGKLIVVDGTDGSGKATQIEFLKERLKKEGKKVAVVDFPEYYGNFFGGFIAHCLREQYFNFVDVHPKIASVLYAADRWESKEKIENWLKKGYVVLANRYVSANQIHQGGKITDAKKRKDFLHWLDTMEHEVFKIPRPDLVIYLSLPIAITQKLIKGREKTGQKRAYLRRKTDLVEYNIKYLEDSRKSALKLVKELNNFVQIDCSKNGEILSREKIHEMVYKTAKKTVK